MAENDLVDRLSRIQTLWSKLLAPGATAAETLRQELLVRYYGAAFRYLLGIVRDPGVAEELAQDFAVRFMRGDYRNADPERGRFRDFLKTALRNQVRDYWRRQDRAQERQPGSLFAFDPAAPPEPENDGQFLADWREELLAQTWEALAQLEETSGKPYCKVLRLKTQDPALRSPELAERLGKDLGKSISPESLRQTLHRAREAFADLLLEEVQRSLGDHAPARLEEELIELQLMDYCRQALGRRKNA